MSGPTGDGGPHAFVTDLDQPELDAADRHHFERVLRLRVGDPCTVSDGRGAWRPCRLAPGVLEPTGDVIAVPAAVPPVAVAFALVKGAKPELVVQKLTELGIDVIRPFTAARSVVRWDDDKRATNHVRLRRVAREAAMQSRRVHLPEVAEVVDFATVSTLSGACLADRGGDPPSLDWPLIVVGPEGGWAPEERGRSRPVVALGRHVLRAETAAIAAGVVLDGLRSGLLAPPKRTVAQ